MTRPILAYTKKILESVSFDPSLFKKELEKALNSLLPYEIEELKEWMLSFVYEKPELEKCLPLVSQ